MLPLVLSLALLSGSVTATPASAVAELRALETAYKGRIGVYAYDTATGNLITYRSGERFPFASTFKAVLAAAVLDKEPDILRKRIRYDQKDLQPHSPVTAKHVATGMTVAQLCEAAVTESDGTAANLLLRQIGGPKGLTRYFRGLHDPVSRLDRPEPGLNDWSPTDPRDSTTPAAMGRDLHALTLGGALDAGDRERLTGWLVGNRTGDRRIRAGLPASWKVGDKTGTAATYGATNDVAVVWPAKGGKPIIMAIYARRAGKNAAHDENVIAKTATIVARGLGKL
ncbi:class A beta-lactamase [Herbidospora galbida]|uniref:Beta-lactamase n=1 Tax=Herbidospora galbida TaxID=2575442 RepID=A0A4U3MBS3_9ACTN|nr:class A beta-lactamase [Herbidospora galbida]TKK86565.1 class A beta-lactamase [Herbidospora galbida]